MTTEEQKRLRRKIEDYLRKYAEYHELVRIACILGIAHTIKQSKSGD